MEKWCLTELELEPVPYDELKTWSALEIARRADDLFDKQHHEIYRIKDLPLSSPKVCELLHSKMVGRLDAAVQKKAVLIAYELVFMWEATMRAIGTTNGYVYDSEAAKVSSWKSPSVQIMHVSTRIWASITARALLDKFTQLLYLLENGVEASDVDSRVLRKLVANPKSQWAYFSILFPFKNVLDAQIRTPFLHKRSAVIRMALCMNEPPRDDRDPLFRWPKNGPKERTK